MMAGRQCYVVTVFFCVYFLFAMRLENFLFLIRNRLPALVPAASITGCWVSCAFFLASIPAYASTDFCISVCSASPFFLVKPRNSESKLCQVIFLSCCVLERVLFPLQK
ncbi:hypothetical protein GQ55_3G444900 [Panicum hallii var. hallii]|uniref:Uncharacterized protein n=1 Tax=Panicum hallii var. hallii TaxID=1504633 RepID=A0A2T7EI97_9POAL|nr:hypothetical protein GQ55_3G444900 [Panicum hallii var. hallii]